MPSPKLQNQLEILEELAIETSVKVMSYPSQTGAVIKLAIGRGHTVTVCETVAGQFSFVVMVRVTRYVPGALYTCDGFCMVDDPPSPKSHAQVLITPDPTTDRSVKFIGLRAQTVSNVNSAIGAGCTIIVLVIESVHPFELVTIRRTLYGPELR